jgi:hypothetical protein
MFLTKYEMAHTDATLRKEMESDPPDDANLGLDDLRELFRFVVGRSFLRRVEEFGGGRPRKSAQNQSPRVRGRRSGSARQTPMQKRTTTKQKATPVTMAASQRKPTIRTKPPITITSELTSTGRELTDSDIESDVVVIQIIPKVRR